MVKVQSYDEFIASVDKDHQNLTATDVDKSSEVVQSVAKAAPVQDFKQLLTFLHNGSFYRRKKIYLRIKQQQ